MNYFLFIIKTALFDFSRNKSRTFLTSLGILIGVMAVVLLVAFGLGLKKYISDQFESLGTNLIRILPGKVLEGGGFRGAASFGIRFDEKDLLKLKRVRALQYVVPVYSQSLTVSAGKENELSDLYASSADIFPALNLKLDYGKLFTNTDVNKRNKIVVIGPKLAEKLFGDKSNAVGRSIKVDGQSFLVIGVLEPKGGGGFGGPDLDNFTYMPYKTAYIFNTDKKFVAIITKVKENISLDTAKSDISKALETRYDEEDFSILEQTEILNAISSIFTIMNTVLLAIAAISLVVGGIGIMNIMYVTVTERIKEIGIRRAIGARKSDILWQFLIESVILSLFGGLTGLVLAYLIVLAVQQIFPAYVNIETVALALGVSTLIGVVFGVFPAKKAADLSPIDAIRYE